MDLFKFHPMASRLFCWQIGETTGGYPRIGEVATVDLPLIAQAMPGAKLYFEQIDHRDAEQALFKQEAELRELAARIKLEAFSFRKGEEDAKHK
ncbi:hypothetical protein BsIDN1_08140 [Bacillus safensis]|uniref:Carboxyltransferase domain-containing protein n=1 Tax=Bacillus safensis TaxID=561879 RepID=A0A5S9M6N8_BACIA|nr:hypothetical protein BsIDN1_08140 [Bacillus safensis]